MPYQKTILESFYLSKIDLVISSYIKGRYIPLHKSNRWSFIVVHSSFPSIPSGTRLHNHGKPPFFMDTSTISMAIFKFANCWFTGAFCLAEDLIELAGRISIASSQKLLASQPPGNQKNAVTMHKWWFIFVL